MCSSDLAAEIPSCWKSSNPRLSDGQFRILVPGREDLTARDLLQIIKSLQSEQVARFVVGSIDDKILLEVQLIPFSLAKKLGFPDQESFARSAFRKIEPFFSRGLSVECLEERKRQAHH